MSASDGGSNRSRPSAIGRLLRTLRLAAGMTQAQAAISIEASTRRIKELEAGRQQLGYLEGLRLAKAYLLCPQCFRRSFEASLERDGLDVASENEARERLVD